MKTSMTYFALGAGALLALTQVAAAQGTSGGTGAVASIPGSVVRGHEQGPGLISIVTGSALPNANLDSKHSTHRPDEGTRITKQTAR
jgi:hypothetical protein